MPYLISNEVLTARKDHRCMASDFVREDLVNLIDCLSFTEKRELVKARRNKWMVKKGERYIRQCLKGDGIYTFKAIPAMHDICIDHSCYGDD